MRVIDNVEEEDDLSPLRAALEKAWQRSEKLTKAREKEELAALKVAEDAINERDTLDAAKREVQHAEHTMKKREEQLKKMAQQKENIEAEMTKYGENDVLASVDSPSAQDAASVGARALTVHAVSLHLCFGCAAYACVAMCWHHRWPLPVRTAARTPSERCRVKRIHQRSA